MEGLVGGKKAIQSLRLRLHSGLRQSGAPSAWLSFGTPEGVPFLFAGLILVSAPVGTALSVKFIVIVIEAL
jgi:hypothetical protein